MQDSRTATVDAARPGTDLAPLVFRLTFVILALGLVWRLFRYLLCFPIWGDEAMLALGIVRLDYVQLLFKIDNGQLAPLLFLWGEKAAYQFLGPGEYAMRLLPFVAGNLALLLYCRVATLLLQPTARLFAIGFLAVAIWPVSMCTLLKPYSFDLLASVMLVLPAAEWLRRPERTGWLLVLAVLAPIASLGSYPVAFVGGGVSLALLLPVLRAGWTTRCLYAVWNVALLAGFAAAMWVGKNHMSLPSAMGTAVDFMNSYWEDAFPPKDPISAGVWLALQTTGQMSAYPIGASNGGSIVTVLLAAVGLAELLRRRQFEIATLLVGPIALNLLAAILHKYPYGGSCRISQHLAPMICLMAGLGIATLIERVRRTDLQARWIVGVTAVFAVIGIGGMVRDYVRPHREMNFVWTRETTREMLRKIAPGEALVACNGPDAGGTFNWYWLTERERVVTWNGDLPADLATRRRVWAYHYGNLPDGRLESVLESLQKQDPSWRLAETLPYVFTPTSNKEDPECCQFARFERD